MLKNIILACAVATLSACGTMSEFKNMPQKGDTIYLKAQAEDIQVAAIQAMGEKRLGSPEIEEKNDGFVIYAEQSAVAGMVFNSYGGYGKVSVSAKPSMGQDVHAVSAVTRSRAVMEPVGSQDAMKGWNYNNPFVARSILERIKELVSAKTPD